MAPALNSLEGQVEDQQVSSVPRLARLTTRHVPLDERIGPPPADVASLDDQLHELLLLADEAVSLKHTNVGYYEERIRIMINQGRWA